MSVNQIILRHEFHIMGESNHCVAKISLFVTFLLALTSLVIGILAFNDANDLKTIMESIKQDAQIAKGATGSSSTSMANTTSLTLDEILRRGFLRCGVPSDQAGFAVTSASGDQIGFDADLCRAVAAAVFGKSLGYVEFVPISSGSERWKVLRDKKIDVLARVTTLTMERDIFEVRLILGVIVLVVVAVVVVVIVIIVVVVYIGTMTIIHRE